MWAIFGTLFGVLLVTKLGTVAVWAGWVMIALGLFRAYQLVQSFLHPAGTIIVSDKQVSLPIGLHRARAVQVTPADVTAVYFLRRSVPWNRAAPVLVVELGSRAMLFPRDWFASEADQRHVVHALLSQRSDLVPEPRQHDGERASEPVVLRTHAYGEIGAGLILLAIGIGGTAIGYMSATSGGGYRVFVGPIVFGFLLLLRGLTQRY